MTMSISFSLKQMLDRQQQLEHTRQELVPMAACPALSIDATGPALTRWGEPPRFAVPSEFQLPAATPVHLPAFSPVPRFERPERFLPPVQFDRPMPAPSADRPPDTVLEDMLRFFASVARAHGLTLTRISASGTDVTHFTLAPQAPVAPPVSCLPSSVPSSTRRALPPADQSNELDGLRELLRARRKERIAIASRDPHEDAS